MFEKLPMVFTVIFRDSQLDLLSVTARRWEERRR